MRARGRLRRLLFRTLVIALVAFGCGVMVFRHLAVNIPALVAGRTVAETKKVARDIAAEVAAALQIQPRVVVAGKTVVRQQSEVLTLSTAEETLTERHRFDESWLHSTKTLEVEGDFVARAGFDLADPFVITVDQDGNGLRISLPPARLLGVETRDIRFLKDESGLWNALTPADRERALRELRAEVERKVAAGDLLAAATAAAEQRLRELLETHGRTVRFESAQ